MSLCRRSISDKTVPYGHHSRSVVILVIGVLVVGQLFLQPAWASGQLAQVLVLFLVGVNDEIKVVVMMRFQHFPRHLPPVVTTVRQDRVRAVARMGASYSRVVWVPGFVQMTNRWIQRRRSHQFRREIQRHLVRLLHIVKKQRRRL